MGDDLRDNVRQNDPKSIWKNQPTPPGAMTLEKIRENARHLRAKTRRELTANAAMVLVVIAISIPGAIRTNSTGLRIAFALAVAWSLAGQYFLHRGMWTGAFPADAALRTSLEFYRRELQRSGHLFRRVLEWSFGPVVLSICAFIVELAGIALPRGLLARMIPFCALFLMWIVAFFLLRSRQRGKLRRAMDELSALEKESGG